MTHYTSLMAHLEVDYSNAAVLQATRALAHRLPARVMGIAALQPVPIVNGEGYAFGEQLTHDIYIAQAQLTKTEAQFHAALSDTVPHLMWRSTMDFSTLSQYLVGNMRCADLLISGLGQGDRLDALLDPLLHLNVGDLLVQAGRPVLLVPPNAKPLALEFVLVGWEDTRECRRAVLDAVPLLQKALHVQLVKVVDKDDTAIAQAQLDDVAAWLVRHGIVPHCAVVPMPDDDTVRLSALAVHHGADLIVAGAYGHNRLREWVLGGVTQDLLANTPCSVFLSH